MITEQDIQALLPQYPSHAAGAGITPRDWAIDRLSRMPAPAQPVEPAPAFDWTRYDEIDRRNTATMDRILDPLRAAQAAAQRARIQAQVRPLVEQRDALNQQLAKLDEEYRRWL
jgi:hypothetical protein